MKTTETTVRKVIDGLQDGLRHKDALALAGMTWNQFQAALPRYPKLAEIYGPIDTGTRRADCVGFACIARLIGREYRDILPQIADTSAIEDSALLGQALEVSRLLKLWIAGVEKARKRIESNR